MANKNTIIPRLLPLIFKQQQPKQLLQQQLSFINKRYFSQSTSLKQRNKEKAEHEQELKIRYERKKQQQEDGTDSSSYLATQQDHLPSSLEIQDDLDLKHLHPLKSQQENQQIHMQHQQNNSSGLAGSEAIEYTDELGEKLTYSQEYYILNRDELLKKRKEKEEEAKFGDFSAKLVKRPQKNFLWGFGTQVHDESGDYFTKGKLPTIREIIRFLEVYQMKDISVVNLKALGRDQMENYAIVCSGFSVKHLYNTAKLLNQEIKKLDCPEIINKPKIAGRKDDSWFLLTIKEIQVHMILHEYREDLDLEFRWLNPPPSEMVNKWKLYEKMGRRSENIQVDDDTFKQYQYYDDDKQRGFKKSRKENINADEVAQDKI